MSLKKSVFIVGGTGFLGRHTALEFVKRGWSVTAAGLPPAPPASIFPDSVRLVIRNLETTSDATLFDLFKGHSAIVYAAGLDDRYSTRRPAYPRFYHANVEVCTRILRLARAAGIRRAVVMGSYFAHFNRLWPSFHLAERHPYIRSRVEQEQAVTSISGLEACVLELPYIFGDTFGKRPLWYLLVKYLRSSPLVFYMRGGSACITAQTAGQAAAGAIEHEQAGNFYPIGDENLNWTELLPRLADADGRKVRVALLPSWLISPALWVFWLYNSLKGIEHGLDARYLLPLQTAETFIDPLPSRLALGYETGGLDLAFQQTVENCI